VVVVVSVVLVVGSVVVVVVVVEVVVEVVVVLVDVEVGGGTVSLKAGTQSSPTVLATRTAGPKLVLLVETVCGANCPPANFAW